MIFHCKGGKIFACSGKLSFECEYKLKLRTILVFSRVHSHLCNNNNNNNNKYTVINIT